MENKEINIAAILKDTPRDTQLFCPWLGNVWFSNVEENGAIRFKPEWGTGYAVRKDGTAFDGGDVQIFPSKYMRDWEKFAWKKGDVLLCGVDNLCIFDSWANDSYTEFYGRYSSQNYSIEADKLDTEGWTKVTNTFSINNYISKINEFHNGNLIRSTLEIKKQEFKDGDIVFYEDSEHEEVCSSIFIFRGKQNHTPRFLYHAILDSDRFFNAKEGAFGIYEGTLRPATDSEKQQLFDDLAKVNKAWDAEKKAIVDLLKPMDWCLMRDFGEKWKLCQFGFKEEEPATEQAPYNAIGGNWFNQCIPYNEQTKHLLGTSEPSELDE